MHGVAYSEVASIRWIPDALAILRAPGVAVDWQVFVGEARRRGLEPPLFEALGYLVREFHAEVPAWVVRSFARPWSWMARQRYAELAHEWGDVRTPGQVVAELAQHLDGRRPRDAATVALRFFRHRLDPTRPTHMARQLARPLLILLPKPARDAVRAWGRRDRFPCPDARA